MLEMQAQAEEQTIDGAARLKKSHQGERQQIGVPNQKRKTTREASDQPK